MNKPSNTEVNAVEDGRLDLLQTEMEKCLIEKDFSDLAVECGGSSLKCHRAIVSTISTKFKQFEGLKQLRLTNPSFIYYVQSILSCQINKNTPKSFLYSKTYLRFLKIGEYM